MTTLTMREEKRLKIIQRVYRGELTVVEAALVVGVSERQCYRIKGRVSELGAKGVVHGNRGRPCKRKIKEKLVKRIVELAKGKYRGFNDRHLTEKLKEQEQIELCREKIRRILRSHGISSPRKRRANQHRSRRDRRAAEGMMLQVDGSPHDWLEGRGPVLTLVGMIDDATGRICARFHPSETARAYMDVLGRWLRKHGRPVSWYCDRHGIFRAESKLLGADEPVVLELRRVPIMAMQPSGIEVQVAEVVTPPPAEETQVAATRLAPEPALPRTASTLPLIGLFGLLALGGAFVVRAVANHL